jgi:hypothetical protein
VEHVNLTADEAKAINEKVIANRNQSSELGKASHNPLQNIDVDSVYDQAVRDNEHKIVRITTENVPNDPTLSDEAELADTDHQQYIDYGRSLSLDEEKVLSDRLLSYADNREESRPLSPAEENMTKMLVMDPDVSDKTIDKLASNHKFAGKAAEWIINSPANTEHSMRTMWASTPSRCLIAQKLPSDYVSEALRKTDGPLDKEYSKNALSHPKATVDDAYSYIESLDARTDIDDSDKADLEWSLALNPNESFQRGFAEKDVDGKHLITREWNRLNAES